MSEKQELINKQLTLELRSKDPLVVLEAVKKIRSVGNPELIPVLLETWFAAGNEVEKEVTELLYTLKDKTVIEPLVEALDDKRFLKNRERILSVFWNAGLDPKNHLSVFVRVALEGNYMEALEALTVIENLEPPLPEEELMDSLLQLKDYFSKPNVDRDEKYMLIRTIATFVKVNDDFQEGISVE